MKSQSLTNQTAIIDKFVDAYNSGDARAFANFFKPDVAVYEHPDMLVQKSRNEIFDYYEKLFKEFPLNRTEVLHRIVIGDHVIDHERVRRRPDGEPFEVLAIYAMRDGLIERLDFIRK